MPRRAHLRPRPRSSRPVLRSVLPLVLASALAVGLGGCGSLRVEGDGPGDAQAQQACRELLDDLPATLVGRERVATSGNPYAVAWGDPPLLLRCGVPEPADLTPVSRCERVDGVDWFAPEEQSADQDADATLTTVGRDPRVELYVPARLRPPVEALGELADVVRRHTRELEPCQ